MQRSAMPARSKPLAPGAALARTAMKRLATARLTASRRLYAEACAVVDRRAAGQCELCGSPDPSQHHHRKARQAGGSSRTPGIHSPANLLAVCGWCHEMAEQHPERWDCGWKVHRGHDPATVPVLLVLGGHWTCDPVWAVLGDDGSRTVTDGEVPAALGEGAAGTSSHTT